MSPHLAGYLVTLVDGARGGSSSAAARWRVMPLAVVPQIDTGEEDYRIARLVRLTQALTRTDAGRGRLPTAPHVVG